MMIFCPNDNIQAREANAKFCTRCGESLRHHCPSCNRAIVTHAVDIPPTRRCPGCDSALWQCRTCGWLATPGHADCENPGCPRGSLVPLSAGSSQLGGGSGRTGHYKIPGVPPGGGRFLANPRFTRVPISAEIRGAAVGTSRLWLFCADPGGLQNISLPGTFVSPLVAQTAVFSGRPHSEATDPIAIFGDRLYLLTTEGAVIRSETATERTLPGNFVAQILHESGWLLVESTALGARVHRCSLAGDHLAPPTDFQERREYIGWSLPVADDMAAYLTDDQGRAWRFPWDGGAPSPLGTIPGAFTTLMLDGETLFVLPVARADIPGQSIVVGTGHSRALAPVQRPPLAFALDGSRIWLGCMDGTTSNMHLASLDRQSPTSAPRSMPGVPESVLHLCTLSGPGGEDAVIALLKGNGGLSLRGWYSKPPFEQTGSFAAVLGAGIASNDFQRLICCDSWLGVCCGSSAGSEVVLYHLVS